MKLTADEIPIEVTLPLAKNVSHQQFPESREAGKKIGQQQ
jgi:hypothetical protein